MAVSFRVSNAPATPLVGRVYASADRPDAAAVRALARMPVFAQELRRRRLQPAAADCPACPACPLPLLGPSCRKLADPTRPPESQM